MRIICLVGLGGFVGAILRYIVSGYVQGWTRSVQFPYGTLAVNVIGCFFIGMLMNYMNVRGAFVPETRVFIFIGVLGAFTTFSTFSNETWNLLRGGEYSRAIINLVANNFLCLLGVWCGHTSVSVVWR